MSDIEFRVLGPVEVTRSGVRLRIAGKTTLTLLTGLLLSPNRVIPVETLMAWAWPDEPPAHPRAALHNGLSRLRRLLGKGSVDTLGWGYRLCSDADHHDLLSFERLHSSALAAAASGQLRLALAELDEAASLWRTPLLGNVDSPSLERDLLPDLTERYLSMLEERNELRIRLGLHQAVLAELPELVRAYPVRERLIGQHMLALTHSGRRVEALHSYERLKVALNNDFGIDPGTSLQLLRSRILHDEFAYERR